MAFVRRPVARAAARRASLVVALLVLVFADMGSASPSIAPLAQTSVGRVRAAVAFVGDSNIVLGIYPVTVALGERAEPYEIVNLARSGTAVRTPDCPTDPCATHDYWAVRIGQARLRTQPDAWVIDLGINDALALGTETTPGYAWYGLKIDWLMRQLGGKRALWSNLPCKIEPPPFLTGCRAINKALAAAPARWPNLTLVDWATAANSHPDYIASGSVHFLAQGQTAWAQLIAGSLDARFPA